jgi:hypothetical protein
MNSQPLIGAFRKALTFSTLIDYQAFKVTLVETGQIQKNINVDMAKIPGNHSCNFSRSF